MARVEREALKDQKLSRVFLATSMAEARQAESLLAGRGLNYVVEVEAWGTSLFGSVRHGAMFYVDAGQADYCRRQLTDAGLEIGVVDDPPE